MHGKRFYVYFIHCSRLEYVYICDTHWACRAVCCVRFICPLSLNWYYKMWPLFDPSAKLWWLSFFMGTEKKKLRLIWWLDVFVFVVHLSIFIWNDFFQSHNFLVCYSINNDNSCQSIWTALFFDFIKSIISFHFPSMVWLIFDISVWVWAYFLLAFYLKWIWFWSEHQYWDYIKNVHVPKIQFIRYFQLPFSSFNHLKLSLFVCDRFAIMCMRNIFNIRNNDDRTQRTFFIRSVCLLTTSIWRKKNCLILNMKNERTHAHKIATFDIFKLQNSCARFDLDWTIRREISCDIHIFVVVNVFEIDMNNRKKQDQRPTTATNEKGTRY